MTLAGITPKQRGGLQRALRWTKRRCAGREVRVSSLLSPTERGGHAGYVKRHDDVCGYTERRAVGNRTMESYRFPGMEDMRDHCLLAAAKDLVTSSEARVPRPKEIRNGG